MYHLLLIVTPTTKCMLAADQKVQVAGTTGALGASWSNWIVSSVIVEDLCEDLDHWCCQRYQVLVCNLLAIEVHACNMWQQLLPREQRVWKGMRS